MAYTEDTIVVSANREKDNVKDMLFNQNRWYAVDIDKRRRKYIKHFALYEGDPTSAIQVIADVEDIILLDLQEFKAKGITIKPEVIQSINSKKEEGKKYVILFKQEGVKTLKTPVKPGQRVPFVQGRRYTNYRQLQHTQQQNAPTLDDLFPKKP